MLPLLWRWLHKRPAKLAGWSGEKLLQRGLIVKLLHRLRVSIGLIGGAMTIGVVGFMVIDDYDFVDAFFMTVITISTVGYGEIQPLSHEGRLFASFLIITNVSVFLYVISSVTTFFLEGDAKQLVLDHRNGSKIRELKGHTVVCGFGRNGRQVTEELKHEFQPFVVIEQLPEELERLRELRYLFIEGDATNEETLAATNLENAKAIITTLPSDANNVYVALTAREMNPDIVIISRASHEHSESKLRRAGCDHVIMPEKIGGSHMAAIVVKPDTMAFIGLITKTGQANFFFEEVMFEDLKPEHQNKTLGALENAYETDANIIGLKTPSGEFIINPGSEYRLQPGSKLIVLGNSEQIRESQRLWLTKPPKAIRA